MNNFHCEHAQKRGWEVQVCMKCRKCRRCCEADGDCWVQR